MITKASERGLADSGVRARPRGKVWLVGAGPGDPELLTVRALRLVQSARVLALDLLVPETIASLAPAAAERIVVGRRVGRPPVGAIPGAAIHPEIVERALAGLDVVRLKGGDPMVFGRGGEEADELDALGIPFEIVPGITAALGAAASAGVPLTHRDASSSVAFVTARLRDGALDADTDLAARVPREGTVVLYMGLGVVRELSAALVRIGRDPATPCAVVSHATLPSERSVFGTLTDIAARAEAARLAPPALLVVGDVVDRRVVSTALGGERAEQRRKAR
jgi:uroporphyrin-III C-methyltransferase